MAPSRGKGKAAVRDSKSGSGRSQRRSTRSRANISDDEVPDIYRSMLAEADHQDQPEERPSKKRKIATSVRKDAEPQVELSAGRSSSTQPAESSANQRKAEAASPRISSVQTVEDSELSDGSEFEFEDVDLDGPVEERAEGIEDLSISVQPESSTKKFGHPKRKPPSVAEKAQRLLTHRLHALCLLGHCMFVNGRCNNTIAQKHLRKLLSARTISYLNPKTIESQFQRNRSFMDGLQQAVDSFKAEYRPTGAGLTRPHWEIEGEAVKSFDSISVDRSDFLAASQSLEGSQDMGNQLFCTMLRSAGVDARIVCSLQVLPFASVAKAATPKKPEKEIIFAMASSESPSKAISNANDAAIPDSSTIGSVPSARRRLGQPSFASAESTKPTPTPKKKTRSAPKLSFPVFWVEAFNEANQKWIPIDPVVTQTINKPSKIEPPSSYEYNQLFYAIAFEKDGSARDVTRRYAKAYNAKTRRHRVEASADGAKWLKKVMRFFRRRNGTLDRDQVEDAELAQKEAREGMPANVLDFKDHPYYALERHLKRHEVIHPKKEVGKVNAGTAAKPRMEPVFRRKDVFVCRSADKWYRVGREIKEGEQPLKHVPARARRQRSIEDDEEGEAPSTTGLYAPYQTQIYVPPPVQRGRVAKNMYGNLDIYAPSMVPAGGVHIRHPLAQRAAKLLRVDYADAVTGFKFQGRHGTAIMEGVVVAQQFGDAVRAVIEGFVDEQLEEESKARSLLALKVWKRFLTGLRIKERVEGYGDGPKPEVVDDEGDTANTTFFAGPLVDDSRPLITAGKFTIDELTAPTPKPPPAKKKRVVRDDSDDEYVEPSEDEEGYEPGGFFPSRSMDDTEMAGGFMPATDDEPGGFLPDGDDEGHGGLLPQNDDDAGGGFLPDSNQDDQGGGFVPENGEEDPGRGFEPEGDQHGDQRRCILDETHDSGGFLPGNHDNVDDMNGDDDLFGEEPMAQDEKQQTEPHAGIAMIATSTANSEAPAIRTGADSMQTADEDTTAGDGMDPDDGESEKGSLLSHDPEDDDAEPDWLDSD